MTEKPKSSQRFALPFLLWLIFFFLIVIAMVIVGFTTRIPKTPPYPLMVLLVSTVGASILVCLLVFIRWVSCWRNLRRASIALAILATLVAIFYTVEYWRGKRAWENCKREAEAEGIVLDWSKFIPPPVPDDQNFYTASTGILLRFKQHPSTNDPDYQKAVDNPWLKLYPLSSNGVSVFPIFDTSKSGPIIVAKIIILRGNENALPSGTNTFIVTLNDAEAADQIQDKIRDFIRTGIGQFIVGAQGFNFSEFQLTSLPLAQIFVRASTAPSVENLNAFCPSDAVAGIGKLKVVPTTDPNTFDILLTDMRITAAANYLKWSDQFVPAFDEIREALKRPYAILPGDYSVPYQIPIPNFVTMRALAQTLAQRAQCYFLLKQPDNALHELTLVHDICRTLEKPPTGEPETLVEAMINVAIHGLYVDVVAQGFQRHAWQEPQIIALQQQLAQITLPVPVASAFKAELAGTTHTLDITPPRKLTEWFPVDTSSTRKTSFWQPISDWKWLQQLKMWLIPRGWIYQNMAVVGQFRWANAFDPDNETILPAKLDENLRVLRKMTSHPLLPYNFLANIAVPNFSKAWQVTAYNQTQVNEAQIACALERFRLAHGEYPNSLDSLVPQFMETIPHDIIGGQPLIYRRTDDGKFLLYSVGWNETDDGGQPSPHSGSTIKDYNKGDWVWPTTAK